MKKWYVYILKCNDGTLYTGITDDLDRRLEQHNTGKGAKYTRGRGPVTLLYEETYSSKGEALSREHAIKALKRAQKLALMEAALKNS